MLLIVDDDSTIRLSLKLILERNEYTVVLAETPKAAVSIVRDHPEVELVLMDMNYDYSTTGDEGLTLLRQIKLFRPNLPCILMTAWGTIDLAVQGMRAGAFDFITKPWNNGVLLDRIETAIKLGAAPASTPEEDTIPLKTNARGKGVPSGGSSYAILPSLSSIYATISRIAPTNATVLITGESGTGKELIAEAIHRQSCRAAGPFVKVNLGGISTSLFESEMFGHKKGSFTDAKEDRIGRFELAKGGTIFLDEIGELDLASQVKLLRVLQDQTYEILGDSKTRHTDVRVVCATNADLQTMVEEHTFREDLYYRINLIHLHLPPLRERPEDIPLLVDHFLCHSRSLSGNSRAKTITPDAIRFLQSLSFPGNIRELKNLVERTVLMTEKDEITADDFAFSPSPSSPDSAWTAVSSTGNAPTLEELERTAIAASIQKHAGNLSLVAKELGISRGALYRKIEKHGL
ncbi:MAG: sigma-54-dependent Fis family transcriptional regulator [Bacteroidaceae bacterium]|nr:sigma-54-dependent Fis family transcriptional regulator [Bacteroidaceae bacterium]